MQAAEKLKITAGELCKLQIADGVVMVTLLFTRIPSICTSNLIQDRNRNFRTLEKKRSGKGLKKSGEGEDEVESERETCVCMCACARTHV